MILIKLLAVISMFAGLPDSVAVQINSFFAEQLKSYDSFTIEPVNLSENIVSIKFLSGDFNRDKRVISVPAEVKMADGQQVKTYLSFRLRLFRKVLIAGTEIEKNALIKPGDAIPGVIEVNNSNCRFIYSYDELENTVASKKFLAGEFLCSDYIEKAPVIKAGDKVKASLVSGNTVISFDAVSRQDGKENEIIRVVTADKKLFKVKVINSENVTVAE
jgi:flagella basal body P-ring formation protein FlgA